MHLFDQVKARETAGGSWGGPVQLGARVAMADRRFVLDDHVGSLVKTLVIEQPDLVAECLDMIRLPAETFWLEWRDYDLDEKRPFDEPRIGLLVETDAGGRSGEMTLIWEGPGVAPEITPARFAFGLDDAMPPPGSDWYAMEHSCAAIDLLCRHFRMRPASNCGVGAGRWTVKAIADAAWLAGPFMIAFSLLLLRSGEIVEREFSRSKLNRSREARGRSSLLDYTEMRIASPEPLPSLGNAAQTDMRNVRLHHVRGHLVRRGGAIFWRKAHLRGDAAAICRQEQRFTRVRL